MFADFTGQPSNGDREKIVQKLRQVVSELVHRIDALATANTIVTSS